MKQNNLQLTTYNSRAGFTIIELLTVIFIMAMLTTLVLVNFQSLRRSQVVRTTQQDVLSKIRETQSNLLAGKILTGETAAASAYEIVFPASGQTYTVNYFIGAGAAKPLPNCCQTLENTTIQQVTVGGVPKSTATVIRIEAPYGKITTDGAANKTVQIILSHTTAAITRTIVIDGVSGRIGAQ